MELKHLIFLIIFYSFVCGFISGFIAKQKEFSESSWFFIGFFFGIIGVIAAVGLPDKSLKSSISKLILYNKDHEIAEILTSINKSLKEIQGNLTYGISKKEQSHKIDEETKKDLPKSTASSKSMGVMHTIKNQNDEGWICLGCKTRNPANTTTCETCGTKENL